MVNNAVDIGTVISDVLTSTEANVEKLHNLNYNPYLNSYLIKKEYKPLTKVVVNQIEEASTSEANVDVLKFYLHELALIFNLSDFDSYFKGVVING
ncbi:MAG: hypothetical protein IKG36_00930 [Mycoplasmataceae bacterium]|nr:hypothetical protein [Mycoplasmataceae bacterium]